MTGGNGLLPLPYCSPESARDPPKGGYSPVSESLEKYAVDQEVFQTQTRYLLRIAARCVYLSAEPEIEIFCKLKLMVKLLGALDLCFWSPLVSVKNKEGVLCF